MKLFIILSMISLNTFADDFQGDYLIKSRTCTQNGKSNDCGAFGIPNEVRFLLFPGNEIQMYFGNGIHQRYVYYSEQNQIASEPGKIQVTVSMPSVNSNLSGFRYEYRTEKVDTISGRRYSLYRRSVELNQIDSHNYALQMRAESHENSQANKLLSQSTMNFEIVK